MTLTGKARILIVEDQITTSMALEQMLEDNGYKVVAGAGSGEEAVTMAIEYKPDLILMDIKLPGKIDGINTAVTIRSQMDIPSIFLTGHGERELVARASEAVPLGYIMKPLFETQIIAAIEIALVKREQEKQFLNLRKKITESLKRRDTALKASAKQVAEKNRKIAELGQLFENFLKMTGLEEETLLTRIAHLTAETEAPHFGSIPTPFLFLSLQQFQIADMIRDGKGADEIAEKLGISRETVKWHRKKIRKKLGIADSEMDLMVFLRSIHEG